MNLIKKYWLWIVILALIAVAIFIPPFNIVVAAFALMFISALFAYPMLAYFLIGLFIFLVLRAARRIWNNWRYHCTKC